MVETLQKPRNCLSVFGNFVGLALQGLTPSVHWKVIHSKINLHINLMYLLKPVSMYLSAGLEKLTLPSWIDVTSQQLIFWEFSMHNSVISATTFIKNGPNFAPPRLFQAPLVKIKESSSSASHNSVISATASLKIRERFRFSHKSVKIKLLNAWLCTRKNKSFECEIVIFRV